MKVVYSLLVLLLASCMSQDYGQTEQIATTASGLFIVCEGNFQYGNATLDYYDPATQQVEHEAFRRANAMRLGDLAQSMTIYDGRGWIVVNNSHVVFAIDPDNFREIGRIEGLTSPRYIHFISPEKAYITQIWDNRIAIVNPHTYQTTGYIEVPGMTAQSGSTEQMVQIGDYVYCNCWSYQRRIIKIDTRDDRIVAQAEVGIQPCALTYDAQGKLWTLCDGGYAGSPYGHEQPALYRIDPATMTVERRLSLTGDTAPAELETNAAHDTIYWIDGHIWRMDTRADRLPDKPFIEQQGTKYYGLTISPETGELYVADAIDYQQPGAIMRFRPDGKLIDKFYTGVIPGAFCWKTDGSK